MAMKDIKMLIQPLVDEEVIVDGVMYRHVIYMTSSKHVSKLFAPHVGEFFMPQEASPLNEEEE